MLEPELIDVVEDEADNTLEDEEDDVDKLMIGLLIPEGPAIGDVLLATFRPEGPSSEELWAALFELVA